MRSNKINSRKYTVNEAFFDVIDTEEKAYWLGFIAADGYVSGDDQPQPIVAIGISASDALHLEKLRQALGATYPLREYKASGGYKPGTRYVRLYITSSRLRDALISHGVVPNKSTRLKFPDLPDELVRHFVRGYFDGNGSFASTGDGNYSIKFNGTEQFLRHLLTILGCNCSVYRDPRANNFYVSIGGRRQVLRVADWMYTGATVYLERKYNRYLTYKQSMSS